MRRRDVFGRWMPVLLLVLASVGLAMAGPMMLERPRPQLKPGMKTLSLTEVHRRIYGRAEQMMREWQTESMRGANEQFDRWLRTEVAQGSANYEPDRAPTITEVHSKAADVNDLDENGKPGDPVLIRGEGFTPECEVRFSVKPGSEYTVRLPASQVKANVILVRVPGYDTTVVSSEVRGKIAVVKGTRTSEKFFLYLPPRPTWQVISTRDIPEGDEIAKPGEGGEGVWHEKQVHQWTVIWVTHQAGSEHLRGEDYFWRNAPLANGWRRKAVVFEMLDAGNNAGAGSSPQPDESRASVGVPWNVPRNGWVTYALCEIIQGPPGLPYK